MSARLQDGKIESPKSNGKATPRNTPLTENVRSIVQPEMPVPSSVTGKPEIPDSSRKTPRVVERKAKAQARQNSLTRITTRTKLQGPQPTTRIRQTTVKPEKRPRRKFLSYKSSGKKARKSRTNVAQDLGNPVEQKNIARDNGVSSIRGKEILPRKSMSPVHEDTGYEDVNFREGVGDVKEIEWKSNNCETLFVKDNAQERINSTVKKGDATVEVNTLEKMRKAVKDLDKNTETKNGAMKVNGTQKLNKTVKDIHENVDRKDESLKINQIESPSARVNILHRISKIPRANTAVLPVTCQMAKLPVRSKSRNSVDFRSVTNQGKTGHFDGLRRETGTKHCEPIRRQNVSKYEAPRNAHEISKGNGGSLKQKYLRNETEEERETDYPLSSADESLALIGNAGDHKAIAIWRNSKANCHCHNRQVARENIDESWKPLKSSPDLRSIAKKWSLNTGQYVDTSSEEFDLSSDYSSGNISQKDDIYGKNNVEMGKPTSTTNSPANIRHRRQTRFSFFNTLFDIVFWPFLFLRTDR